MNVSDRLYTFLVSRGGEVGSEEVAREALGLQGARGAIADKVVETAAAEDPRVVRGGQGWMIATLSRHRTLRDAGYLVIAHSTHEGTHAVAANRVGFEGAAETIEGSFANDERAKAIDLLTGIERLSASALPVGFRLPGTREQINRLSRTWLGRPVLEEEEGLCLFRLARRRFPDRSFGSLDAIADALGLACVTDRGLAEDVVLGAELLLGLLEQYETEGVTALDEITTDQYPLKDAVHFSSFAFDEEDLADLPESPGVYVMRDREGEVIYVGKSKHLRDRVRTYFVDKAGRPEKTRRILERIWSVDVEEVGSELEALILEARFIQACRPPFNIQVDVHERPSGYDRARRFVLLLPSVDPDSVELFCIDEGAPITQVRVRVDLTDWVSGFGHVERRFFGSSERSELQEEDVAANHILQTWMGTHHETVQVIHVDDAGGIDDLRRLIEDAIVDYGEGEGGKAWRI